MLYIQERVNFLKKNKNINEERAQLFINQVTLTII